VPELPDVTVYVESLRARTEGQTLEGLRLASPFVVRTFEPPISSAAGKRVGGIRRVGKRIVFGLDDELFLVLHLMIAGRFRWKERGAPITGKIGLAAFDFSNGTLLLTEASQKKRASLHLLRGEDALDARGRAVVGQAIEEALGGDDALPGQGGPGQDVPLRRHGQLALERLRVRRVADRQEQPVELQVAGRAVLDRLEACRFHETGNCLLRRIDQDPASRER